MRRQRGLSYALITAAAGVVGLLLLRAPFSSESRTADFLSNRYVVIYPFAAVAATFLGLGYVLARQTDRLRRLSSTDAVDVVTLRRHIAVTR